MVVVYGGERRPGALGRVRMDAVGGDGVTHVVHGWIVKPDSRGPQGFDLPAGSTAGGAVTLQVFHEESGGSGRGAQVSEIWLQRRDRAALETPPAERRG